MGRGCLELGGRAEATRVEVEPEGDDLLGLKSG
jgi:hypothetical protein